MRPSDEIVSELTMEGFAICDNLLPRNLFDDLDARVLASWRSGVGWKTRVKGPGTSNKLPLQGPSSLQQIGQLLDKIEASDGPRFTYLYHQIHNDDDTTGLLQEIEDATIDAWRDIVEKIIGPYKRTNFSLTAFTPGCRLAPHTDHGGQDAYRLTVLLYFSGERGDDVPLMFGDRRKPIRIPAQPNRSVIFIPSTKSVHWIEAVPVEHTQTVRLAFSGWLI